MNCAPHAALSVASCARCGAFACAWCLAGTSFCEACRARSASDPNALKSKKALRYAWASWASPVLGIFIAVWSPFAPLLTGLVVLGMFAMGLVFGIRALELDRFARSPGVRPQAIAGLILSSLPALAAVLWYVNEMTVKW